MKRNVTSSSGVDYPKDTGLQTRSISQSVFPNFGKPQPVGFFSITTDRCYEPTAEQLSYYQPPAQQRFPLDLNIGLEIAIKKPISTQDECIDHLLQFIHDNHERLLINGRLPADFVAYRGFLRHIMCTPYERGDWCIQVIRFKNTCYLCKRDTDFEKQQRAQETPEQKKMAAWGFKFEQYCLTENPKGEPATNVPVDECAEFSCVFKVNLENMTLLFGAEMDGIISKEEVKVESPQDLENLHFVELKVRQGVNCHPRQLESYWRYKMRNWWCQSFLVGINDIFVGLRNEQGLVVNIDHVTVRSLTKDNKGYWSPAVCTGFLVQFLQRVRQLTQDLNCPHTVTEFYFNARTGRIRYRRLPGKTEHSFLPEWYSKLLLEQQ